MSQEYIVKSPKAPMPIPGITVSEFISQRLSSHDPDSIAIIDSTDGTSLSYSNLCERIQKRACGFLDAGFTKNDLVVFFAENSIEYLVSMLALIYLGITFSPLKPASGVYELTNQILDCKCSILITDRHCLEVFERALRNKLDGKQLKLIILLHHQLDFPNDYHFLPASNLRILLVNQIDSGSECKRLNRIPYFQISTNDHLVIIYTSGTTGKAKGAIHTHHSILASILQLQTYISNKLSFLFWYPMGHVSGLFTSLTNLSIPVTMILKNSVDLKQMLLAVEKYKVSHFPISPGHAVYLAQNNYSNQLHLDSLRIISYAGAKIPLEILKQIKQKYQVDIRELYGSTEMMGSVLQTGNDPIGSVGVPCANNQMKIIDPNNGKSLPAYQDGEICFKGPSCFSGYLGNKQATAETIDQEGWYHTGDLGHYDEECNLYIVDRIKELIKYLHWSISPAEIECFLLEHPSVENVCVVGVKHRTDGQVVRAYVQLRDGHAVTEQQLIQYTQEYLGFHKQLRGGVKFVDRINRTAIGKVDRSYYHQLVAEELVS